jgi:hypothetical protein
MTDELMSAHAFKWFLTILTGGLAGAWLVYDSINLMRLMSNRSLDRTDGVFRDKRFGFAMGIVIGVVGVFGCLKFHGVV